MRTEESETTLTSWAIGLQRNGTTKGPISTTAINV